MLLIHPKFCIGEHIAAILNYLDIDVDSCIEDIQR